MELSAPSSFFTPEAWPFLDELAASFPDLQREAREASGRLATLQFLHGSRFAPGYAGIEGQRATFYLQYAGAPIGVNRRLAPATAAALDRVPDLASAALYFLGPRSRILPHKGVFSDIMRAHLGLVVPPGCFLRIGDEVRTWEEGRWLVFDDTPEHEAWNESDRWRSVLCLDFFHRPAQSQDERLSELRQLRSWIMHPGHTDSAWFAAADTSVPDEERPALTQLYHALSEDQRRGIQELVDTYGLFFPR